MDEVERFKEWHSLWLLEDEIKYHLSLLCEREFYMIYQRFWMRQTLEDMGKPWNVSKERSRQILAKGLRKMRRSIEREREENERKLSKLDV